jgi:hypothetical protein
MNSWEFGVETDASPPQDGRCGTDAQPTRPAQRVEYGAIPEPQLNDELENNFKGAPGDRQGVGGESSLH